MSDQSRVRRLTGFAGYAQADAYVHAPQSLDELAAILSHSEKVVLRAGGRSYGDAALAPEILALDLAQLKRIIDFNESTGLLTAQAGTTLDELWRFALPRGYWLPVVTGTSRTTLGGALAMNVHGKNQFKVGAIGEHVVRARWWTPSQGWIETDADHPDHKNLIGSLGGVAALGEATLKLRKVESGMLSVTALRTGTWEESLSALESGRQGQDYAVGWIDLFAGGRGLLHFAQYDPHADPATLQRERQDLPTRVMGIPKSQVWRALKILNRPGPMRLVNSLKWLLSGREVGRTHSQSLVGFSFLLDYVPGWERSYAPGGLIQFQPFVPKDSAAEVFSRLNEMQLEAGQVAHLGVLKRHRPDEFLFSPNLDGFSLALDFRVVRATEQALLDLLHRMAAIVFDCGGRFYAAKDAVLTSQEIARMLDKETVERWIDLRKKYDPEGRFTSGLIERWGLNRVS